MVVVRLEGRIESPEELHAQLQEKLELPAFYGSNLDALWDSLTGYVEMPLTLEWHGFDASRACLGDYADKVVSLFRQAEEEIQGFQFVLK